MNACKFNGMIGCLARTAICKHLQINHTLIYKKVKSIDNKKVVTDDGKVYELTLTEIKNEQGKEGM